MVLTIELQVVAAISRKGVAGSLTASLAGLHEDPLVAKQATPFFLTLSTKFRSLAAQTTPTGPDFLGAWARPVTVLQPPVCLESKKTGEKAVGAKVSKLLHRGVQPGEYIVVVEDEATGLLGRLGLDTLATVQRLKFSKWATRAPGFTSKRNQESE